MSCSEVLSYTIYHHSWGLEDWQWKDRESQFVFAPAGAHVIRLIGVLPFESQSSNSLSTF